MSLRPSITRQTRQAKLGRLTGAMAVKAAKDAGDPDEKRLRRFKNMWKKFRDRVSKKYRTRGRMAALKSSKKKR